METIMNLYSSKLIDTFVALNKSKTEKLCLEE